MYSLLMTAYGRKLKKLEDLSCCSKLKFCRATNLQKACRKSLVYSEKLEACDSKLSVYKYMPLSNCIYKDALVPDGVLFAIRFGSPYSLNDHFDSLPAFKTKSNDKYLPSILERLQKHYRWCCFSIDNKNPLLWALYGDAGRGLCVEYELSKIQEAAGNKLSFKPIKYQQSRYHAERKPDTTQAVDEILKRALMRKSFLWAYEQEIRAVIFDDGERAHKIPGEGEDFGTEARCRRGKEFAWNVKIDEKNPPFVYGDEDSFYLPVKPKTVYLGPQLSETYIDGLKQKRLKDPKFRNDSQLENLKKNVAALKDSAARLGITVVQSYYSPDKFEIATKSGKQPQKP